MIENSIITFFYSDKVTTTTTTNVVNNLPQQLRTATTFLPNQSQSMSQTQQPSQQIRQLFTNANNNSLQTQSTTNQQRLTEAAQRSPSSVSIQHFSLHIEKPINPKFF